MSSVNGGYPAGASKVTQPATPLTGTTVAVADGQTNVLLWLTPATALAGLTVQLPTDGGSFIGEEIQIGTSKAITVLTVTGATTIFNPLSVLQPGDLFILEKVGPNTWARQQ